MTLGIYRFWATTRERRYLWSRSRFVDERLEWAGTGMELFIGFLLVLALFALPFFAIGLLGVLIRRNVLVIFMCLELMLVASTIALVAFSRFNGTMDGNVFVFFILTVAAAGVAVGLAIIVALFRRRQTVQVEELNALKN